MLEGVDASYQPIPTHLYLMGVSMGGIGARHLASRAPDRFAAVVPICGTAPAQLAPNVVTMPICTFHNRNDSVGRIDGTLAMIDAIRAAGGHITATIQATGDHDACAVAANEPDLYPWLLRHRRRPT